MSYGGLYDVFVNYTRGWWTPRGTTVWFHQLSYYRSTLGVCRGTDGAWGSPRSWASSNASVTSAFRWMEFSNLRLQIHMYRYHPRWEGQKNNQTAGRLDQSQLLNTGWSNRTLIKNRNGQERTAQARGVKIGTKIGLWPAVQDGP